MSHLVHKTNASGYPKSRLAGLIRKNIISKNNKKFENSQISMSNQNFQTSMCSNEKIQDKLYSRAVSESKKFEAIWSIPPSIPNKKTLVLDLDETLIHTCLNNINNCDLKINVILSDSS